MHLKQLLAGVTALALGLSLAACGADSSSAAQESSRPAAEATAEPEATPEQTEETPETAGTALRIAGLKGPTTMGLCNLIADSEGSGRYDFTMYGAADEIVPLLVKGELDAAAIPANLAATLYQRTESAVQVACINTLGVLYVVETGDTIQSVADLKGQTIWTTGQGTTPEYVLRYVLTQNGLDPDTDVDIQWASEATEALAHVQAGEATIAMLPQPFVTSALNQVEGLRVALDMNTEWEAVAGSKLVTGVLVARTDAIQRRQCGGRQHRPGRHRRPVRGVRHRGQGRPGPAGAAGVQHRVRDRRRDEGRPGQLLPGPVRRRPRQRGRRHAG